MSTTDQERFVTVKRAAQIFTCFTEASLRWHIFQNTNGIRDRCVRKIGRKKLVIDTHELAKWISDN